MWTFEPKVATAIYQEMIAQYKIPVVMKQRLDLRPGKGVVKDGRAHHRDRDGRRHAVHRPYVHRRHL